MKTGFRLILTIMLVSIILISTLPTKTSAFPYRIEGYVRDSDGAPRTLATISLKGMVYNYSNQKFSEIVITTQTDINGYFRFSVGVDEPDGFAKDSTVTVSYISGTKVVTESFALNGYRTWANLTYQKVPDLTDVVVSPMGIFSMVFIVSIIVIGYYFHVSNKQTEEREQKPKRVERRRRQR